MGRSKEADSRADVVEEPASGAEAVTCGVSLGYIDIRRYGVI